MSWDTLQELTHTGLKGSNTQLSLIPLLMPWHESVILKTWMYRKDTGPFKYFQHHLNICQWLDKDQSDLCAGQLKWATYELFVFHRRTHMTESLTDVFPHVTEPWSIIKLKAIRHMIQSGDMHRIEALFLQLATIKTDLQISACFKVFQQSNAHCSSIGWYQLILKGCSAWRTVVPI